MFFMVGELDINKISEEIDIDRTKQINKEIKKAWKTYTN